MQGRMAWEASAQCACLSGNVWEGMISEQSVEAWVKICQVNRVRTTDMYNIYEKRVNKTGEAARATVKVSCVRQGVWTSL